MAIFSSKPGRYGVARGRDGESGNFGRFSQAPAREEQETHYLYEKRRECGPGPAVKLPCPTPS